MIAVAWSHWRDYWYPESAISYGELGVDTFFVISGFLITGILLDNRSETNPMQILRQFYARRVLRIFPLFYATLAVALLLDASTVRDTWYWHAMYLSNFLFYTHGWLGQTSHFWSLSVEEQFYLLWPLVMIFFPRRFLLPAILSGILFAPLYEMNLNFAHPGCFSSILMPSCMGTLGIGALLAYGVRQNFNMKRLSLTLLLAGLSGCALWEVSGVPKTFWPLSQLAESCVLAYLVYSAANGFSGPLGWLLGHAPLNYLGKISYGLYIIHNFAKPLCVSFLVLCGNPLWMWKLYSVPTIAIAAYTVLTIGLASFSWYLLEKPINKLKRKFPYPADKEIVPLNLPRTDIPNLSP